MLEELKQRMEACDSLYYDADGIPPGVATMGTLRALIAELTEARRDIDHLGESLLQAYRKLDQAHQELKREQEICAAGERLKRETMGMYRRAQDETARARQERDRLFEKVARQERDELKLLLDGARMQQEETSAALKRSRLDVGRLTEERDRLARERDDARQERDRLAAERNEVR